MAYRYPELKAARARALDLGLCLPVSSDGGKKLMVFVGGRWIHFGSRGMGDYLIHGDDERRRLFRLRARGIRGDDGGFAYKDRNSPLFWSYNILW